VNRILFSRKTYIAVVLIATVVLCSKSASAQTAYCWINAATGQPVPLSALVPRGATPDPLDPNHASRPSYVTGPSGFPPGPGADYVRGIGGSWTNAATGQPVPESGIVPQGATPDPIDPNHASRPSYVTGPSGFPPVPGADYVRVPCPPPSQPGQAMAPPTVPILPGIGFGFGIGGGHRGDDRR